MQKLLFYYFYQIKIITTVYNRCDSFLNYSALNPGQEFEGHGSTLFKYWPWTLPTWKNETLNFQIKKCPFLV